MSDETIAISTEDQLKAMEHTVRAHIFQMKASAEQERADVLLMVVRGLGPNDDEKRIPTVRVADKLDAFAFNLEQSLR